MAWRQWRAHWHEDGGGRELFRLAWPLVLSSSVWTLQITIDRIMLSQLGGDAGAAAVAAAMAAAMFFWTVLMLFQITANYATTFVAQYVGADRPHRVGPAVWQALYFSVASGFFLLALVPLAEPLAALGGHSSELQALEAIFFRCLCWSALPTLITAAASSFFAGRSDSWTVLFINTVGLLVTAMLDYAWIYGHWGFPAWGIAGAGWATGAGMTVSAVVAMALLLRRKYREEFGTLSGWKFDYELFGRLMWYGAPSGLQVALDCLAFTCFTVFVGRLGDAELAASSIAFTINIVAFLPMLGIGQGVTILVGQRLGQDQPDLAERTTWTGFRFAWLYMTGMALLYVLCPHLFLIPFRPASTTAGDAEKWAPIAALVPVLLRFIALYSLFDSINLVFSFALKGAGDTRFVTVVALFLSWPVMVLPTWAAWQFGWGIFWAWGFASAYIILLAVVFLWRFLQGEWKSMRVIEPIGLEEADLVAELPITSG